MSTLEGNLLSFLVEIKGDNANASRDVLDIVESIAKEIDSSILTFILNFFKRSYRKKYFGSIISHFIEFVLPKSKIRNGKELLVLFLGIKNCVNWILADQESFWNALDSLDIRHRKVVLFQFKSEIENYYSQNYFTEEWKIYWLNTQSVANAITIVADNFSRAVGIPGTYWQDKRIERANDYENVIIPSTCEKCKCDTAFALKVTKYLESLASSQGPNPSLIVSGDCMKCAEKYSAGAHVMTLPWYTASWT